jgi:hypothetical protein
VPWQLFALLFKGARRVFAAPPRLLLPEGPQDQPQREERWDETKDLAWDDLQLQASHHLQYHHHMHTAVTS